ncbi:hypothetical protein MCUN1_003641 [Malassezia cuniculi]|uniref:Translocation protein sec72 n=1 Tax=Malassezia cuniculi TaxID=948313 RepID=A0AAF0EYE3_9BASI|nr:hypothetical protein MCUN1_003641 [Malassezia cuniculi]
MGDPRADDVEGDPVLVAVDGNETFEFSVDMDKGTVSAPTRDVTVLNLLARWVRLLPPEAPFPPPPHIIQGKISQAVTQAKEAGNNCFRKKDLSSAIQAYSMAIAMSLDRPLWESSNVVAEELSVCLANRSAAYAAANAYIEALCDADAAIQLRRNWSKGHFRKGKALAGLHRYAEARAAFQLGLQFDPDNV